jgi:hypothetical protein
MSFNGSGTFVINSTGQPVVTGTVISSTAFNALTADLATGLTTALTKDGQTTPTANIPMGNFKITGLATGTAGTDAATVSQIQSAYGTFLTVSGTNTITATVSPSLTAYSAGQMFGFVAANTNSGATTINISSLGAKSIVTPLGALVAGDIQSGYFYIIYYDGTNFQLLGISTSLTTLTLSGALSVGGASTFTGAATFNAIKETTTVSATAATGTINFDCSTQPILYYTTNASGNWTLNFRGTSGVSLDTLMATGQTLTVVFMATQGATAYYNSAVQVDGSSVTPKWQGAITPAAGNANSIDAYTYAIIKTGAATFTVLASQTRYA